MSTSILMIAAAAPVDSVMLYAKQRRNVAKSVKNGWDILANLIDEGAVDRESLSEVVGKCSTFAAAKRRVWRFLQPMVELRDAGIAIA